MVAGISLIVSSQTVIVEGIGRLSAHYLGVALDKLYSYCAGDVLPRACHIGSQVPTHTCEPQPIVDEVGILSGNPGLETELIFAQHQVLQGLVSFQQDHGGRRLVNLPGFYAQQSIFNMVNPAYAMPAGQVVNLLDKRNRLYLLALKGYRYPLFEANLQIGRRGRCLLRRPCPQEDILRWFVPGIFEHTTFNAPGPQVLVNGIGTGFGDGDRNTVKVRGNPDSSVGGCKTRPYNVK